MLTRARAHVSKLRDGWREREGILTHCMVCRLCCVCVQRVKSAYVGKFIKAKRKHAETVREVHIHPKP